MKEKTSEQKYSGYFYKMLTPHEKNMVIEHIEKIKANKSKEVYLLSLSEKGIEFDNNLTTNTPDFFYKQLNIAQRREINKYLLEARYIKAKELYDKKYNSLQEKIVSSYAQRCLNELNVSHILELEPSLYKEVKGTRYVDCPNPSCSSTKGSQKTSYFEKGGVIKCFKCQESYGVIKYGKYVFNLGSTATVKKLSQVFFNTDINAEIRLSILDEIESCTNNCNTSVQERNKLNKSLLEQKAKIKEEAQKQIQKQAEAGAKAKEAILKRKTEDKSVNKSSLRERNAIYNIFSKGYSLTGRNQISNTDKQYLINRQFSEEDIKQLGAFTMPSPSLTSSIIKAIKTSPEIRKLNDEVLKLENIEDILIGIPGFYKSNNNFTFKRNSGIGFPIRNAFGAIEAIQIRLSKEIIIIDEEDGTEKKLRYLWFSSSDDELEFGSSCGSPIDVIYPPNRENLSPNIFITEGKLKAYVLAKKTNSIVLSIQGVHNWSGIEDTLRDVQQVLGKEKKPTIFITYDGDMAHNTHVANAARKMSDAIKEAFPELSQFYCLWSPQYGKGIDDVIQANNTDKIKFVKKGIYETAYDKFIKKLESNNILYSKLVEEERERLYIERIYKKIRSA